MSFLEVGVVFAIMSVYALVFFTLDNKLDYYIQLRIYPLLAVIYFCIELHNLPLLFAFLFLAVLGVVSLGNQLDAGNPAADAFKIAAGTVGYKIFGLVFLAAALTSIVGAAYTSVSFLKTLFKVVKDNENFFIIGFIVVSTLILIFLGKPVKLLVLAGSLNGLILPITLAITLIASKKEGIVGKYKHSNILFYLGWVVVLVTAYIGVKSLAKLAELFA